MVRPTSIVSTSQRRDNVTVRERSSQKEAREFPFFARLPLELQEMIWEFTLPCLRPVRLLPNVSDPREFYGSIFKLPKPPKSEHQCSRITLTRGVPRINDIPVALHVCRVSRNLALKSFNLLSVQGTSVTPSLFVGPNDIIDISSLTPTMRDLLKTPSPTIFRNVTYDGADGTEFQVEQMRLLYDMDSGYLCVIIRPLPADLNLPTADQVMVRFSELEEWLFGSKLTMGRVPEYLRDFLDDDECEAWLEFHHPWQPRVFRDEIISPDMASIMMTYVWFLHKMTFPISKNPFPCTSYETHETLRTFVGIMDGNCPNCEEPILKHIKKLYPELSLDHPDILYAIPQSQLMKLQTYGSPGYLRHCWDY
ncbi:hypothetical protein M434DRAFT_39170 [Hypoxylon sp. CO27-5]|nr:hypothetical protein M434DRAFT_39170 [Hypoxylon sp. CO27-5]